jgi:hypothetical protein
MDLATRAQLNTANNTSLFNVSRAGRNAESPEVIQQDAKYTSEMLITILKGILSGQSLMSNQNVILSSIQLIGALSSWLSKGKQSQSSESNPSVVTVVDVFTLIGSDCVRYTLNGLNNPLMFYYSALTLRSLCTRCGKSLAQSTELMNSLIQSWSNLCSSNQTLLRRQLQETIEECGGRSGELDILAFLENKMDILLEVEKSIVQGICMTLKHISAPEMSRYYIEALIQPPMNILINAAANQMANGSESGQENQWNDQDLVTMITVIAIFVRSIRIPQQQQQQRGDSLESIAALNPSIDTSLHPALDILLVHDGSLFQSLLLRHPSSSLAEAISYFFISIVTFISPLLPVSQLSTLVLFYAQHLEGLFSNHLNGACDLIKEIFSVIGSVVQYQRSKELIQSSHSEYQCNASVLNNLEDVLVSLLSTTIQSLFPLPMNHPLFALPFDIFHPHWEETRVSLLESSTAVNSERCDVLFTFLQGLFDHTSCLAQFIPSLTESLTLGVLFLSKRCHNASLSLSACQFLKSIVCLPPPHPLPFLASLSLCLSSPSPLSLHFLQMASGRRSIELRRTFSINSAVEDGSGEGSVSLEFASWEAYIASMISKYRDGIILECLCELLSDEMSSHEALTEGHINLLYFSLADALEISSDFPINEVTSPSSLSSLSCLFYLSPSPSLRL